MNTLAQATTVDLSPLVESAASLLGLVLSALAVWLAGKVRTYIEAKTGAHIAITDAQLRLTIGKVVKTGTQAAVDKLRDSHVLDIDTKSAAIASALNYAKDQAPDALAKLGITDEALEDMVRARLNALGLVAGADVVAVIAS